MKTANHLGAVHLTKSLSPGLTKQIWEEGMWALEDRGPVDKGKHSRTAWLKQFNKITQGMVPPSHMFWSQIEGKGKDRILTNVFLVPLDSGDFGVEAWWACARDFEIWSFPKDIIVTQHLIKRMFLRLATMNDEQVILTLCPVIRFLVSNTKIWSKRNLPEVFDLLTREGRFPVEVKKKEDRFVLKTFVHSSFITDHQRKKFFSTSFSEPRVKYLVLNENGTVAASDIPTNGRKTINEVYSELLGVY